MPKLWSEAPGARAREISADAATLIWVGFWAVLCSRLYAFLAGLAKAGRAIREAHRAIRLAPRTADLEIERLLASRALHRLSYRELLVHTPDPFGDWASGRYDRLARAELASVGLRPGTGVRRS